MKQDKIKRKTLVAREDLVDLLSVIAKQKGYSLFNTVNEIFELVIKAEQMGINLRMAIEERNILRTAKEAGFILGLESLWYEMAELIYEKAKDEALKMWFEAGVWFAKRYVTSDLADPIEAFQKDLQTFMWNVSEIAIEKAENKISVRLISPRFPESYTILFASFLEGAIEAFNYKLMRKEISKGNIRLESVKEEDYVKRKE